MKSFEQIAEAMYRKWQAALIRFRKPMPFYQLEAHEQQAWIAAAKAAHKETQAADHIEREGFEAWWRENVSQGLAEIDHDYRYWAIWQARAALDADHIAQDRKMVAAQEPFGYFKAEPFGWRDCAETDEGAVALYTAPQPQADALDAVCWVSESDYKPLESDGEVLVRFSDGTFGTGWASYWHGASDDFAQWSHPDPEEDRTVTHWMKPPAIDAAVAAKENK